MPLALLNKSSICLGVASLKNNIGHPSLENNFKNEPVRTIKIN